MASAKEVFFGSKDPLKDLGYTAILDAVIIMGVAVADIFLKHSMLNMSSAMSGLVVILLAVPVLLTGILLVKRMKFGLIMLAVSTAIMIALFIMTRKCDMIFCYFYILSAVIYIVEVAFDYKKLMEEFS